MSPSLLIGIPVYKQIELTHALVRDLAREEADFVIIDNAGDYTPLAHERVISVDFNLGWAGGSNLAFRTAFSEGFDYAMTLNNDTRLSQGFVTGLLDPRLPDDAGIICPVYDDSLSYPTLASHYRGPAVNYQPADCYRPLPVADGTGMVLKREAWVAAGELDTRSFGPFAWGADADLCLRVAKAGFGIYGTEMSYMNHLGKRTVLAEHSKFSYHAKAGWAMSRGMRKLYGRDWRCKVDKSTTVPVISLINGTVLGEHVPADITAADA